MVEDYALLGELGRGAMGVVYKARQVSLNRIVALKMVLAGQHARAEDLARFRTEAEAVARLQHPNIVQIYQVGEHDGCPFCALEFVNGTTLAKRLLGTPQPPRPAAHLIEILARAIHQAHQRGIVHRDLKPSNVLLAPPPDAGDGLMTSGDPLGAEQYYGIPKISDFGLAKQLDSETASQTKSGTVLGTPSYMAPEQARGQGEEVGPPADVYALGAILYELLTGRPPFKAETLIHTLYQVTTEEPAPPRQLQPKLPRDLETICLRCLAKQPRRRYPSALALAEDLRRFLNGEPILARSHTTSERLWRWCRRNPVPASLLITVTLGSAFGMWHLTRLSNQIVRTTALESTAQQSDVLVEVNDIYSDVVRRVKEGKGVAVTHDYMAKHAAIPIPATFTIELGQQISDKSDSGVQVRLYSDYPFNTRRNGGPKDDFEREALKALHENPDEPYYRFEDYKGRPSLRYATARKLQKTCVECHNSHPDSPKTDWKEGDVRGVVEIIRPLDKDIRKTQEALQGTFLSMGVLSAGLLGLSGLVLYVANHRRRIGEVLEGDSLSVSRSGLYRSS
jgi:serine/threonine protein kinase